VVVTRPPAPGGDHPLGDSRAHTSSSVWADCWLKLGVGCTGEQKLTDIIITKKRLHHPVVATDPVQRSEMARPSQRLAASTAGWGHPSLVAIPHWFPYLVIWVGSCCVESALCTALGHISSWRLHHPVATDPVATHPVATHPVATHLVATHLVATL